MIIGSYCDWRGRISREGYGRVWAGSQKHGFIRNQGMGRKPHIKLPCKILGIIHAYSPNSISWGCKTDKNKLFACACLNQLVINCNDRGFQKERDRGFVSAYDRNAAYGFTTGWDKSNRICISGVGPEFYYKSTLGFRIPYSDFHLNGLFPYRYRPHVMMPPASFIACSNYRSHS